MQYVAEPNNLLSQLPMCLPTTPCFRSKALANGGLQVWDTDFQNLLLGIQGLWISVRLQACSPSKDFQRTSPISVRGLWCQDPTDLVTCQKGFRVRVQEKGRPSHKAEGTRVLRVAAKIIEQL